MSEVEDYLFDLQGYLILEGALSADEVASINEAVDAIPPLEPGEWYGHVHRQDHNPKRGINLQNIIEGGVPFEDLIDHPSWIDRVGRYVDDSYGLFIDEAFVSIRGPGEAINIHSGAHGRRMRGQFRFHNNKFYCGQVNVLVALTDIGPGDGATMVITGSHKSNLPHPAFSVAYSELMGGSMDGMLATVEVYLKTGDALLFVDCLCHGSAARTNAGERRVLIYRYGPGWGNTRFGYQPSEELLARLTPERRQIIQPIPPLRPTCAESE